jgi:hypothetical protein
MTLMQIRLEGLPEPLTNVSVAHLADFGVLPLPDDGLRRIGTHRSIKCGREMPLRTVHELPSLQFAEAGWRVVRYAPQALRISAQGRHGRWSETITRLEFLSEGRFRCVKVYACAAELWDPDTAARMRELSAIVRALGGTFSVEFSEELAAHPGYEAVRSIDHNKHTGLTGEDILVLDHVFDRGHLRPFSALRAAYGDAVTAEAKLGAMVACRMLAIRLHGPIDADLPVWRLQPGV